MKNIRYHHDYLRERIPTNVMDRMLIKRLLTYLRPYRWWLGLAILFLIFSKGVEAYVPIYIGHVTQYILNSINLNDLEKESRLHTVFQGCGTIIGLLVLSYLLDATNVIIKTRIGQRAILELRTQVYEHILRLPLSYYDHYSVGRLMTRTIHDVDQIDQMFSDSVVPILGNLILFLSIGVGIIFVDWKIGLIVALIMPIVWWLTHQFRYHQRRCYERVRSIVSAMNAFVEEHLMGAMTIRNFGLQNKEKARFDQINEDHCSAYLETIHNFASFIASIDFMQNLSLILAFVVLTSFAPPDTGFQAGTYFTFSLYALMFFRPLADLAERYNALQAAMAAAERVFTILDQKEEPKGGMTSTLEEVSCIVFEDVWFAYEKEHWVLKGLSFKIGKGESIAIVGVTGAGKTSIMNLLLRLYEFQKGSIKINGKDIREYSEDDLRKQFSIVLQDPVIFSGTIAENISLYNPNISKEKIDSVINYVNMRAFVNRFPEGIDHHLSERGKTVSVGEMQLISLARAVAYERCVLILDEATANIDTGTERIIQDALKKILKEKTALVIAHRLSTIKDVTRILVIHEGVVAEMGSHQQLLEAKGIYEKLYRLQFLSQQK